MRTRWVIVGVSVLATTSCATILGFDDVEPGETAGIGGGAAAAGGTSPAGGAGGAGGTGAASGGGGINPGELGSPCLQDDQCDDGNCEDGVCCDVASCDGECMSCAVRGHEGTCRAHFDSTDPESECGTDGVCDEAACTTDGVDVFGSSIDGDDDVTITDIAVDSTGHIWVLGHFSGTVSLPGCPQISTSATDDQDILFLHMDPEGQCVQAFAFGDEADQSAADVVVDALDNVFITGTTAGQIDFGGGNIGVPTLRAFIAKFDSTGAFVASKVDTGGDISRAQQATVSATTGRILVTGDFRDTLTFDTPTAGNVGDVFIVELDSDLNETSVRTYPTGMSTPLISAFAPRAAGGVYIAIYAGSVGDMDLGCPQNSPTTNAVQTYMFALTEAGACQNIYLTGAPTDDVFMVTGFAQGTTADSVFATGYFTGDVPIFSGGPAVAEDAFIIEITDDGPGSYSMMAHVFTGPQDQRIQSIARPSGGDVWITGLHDREVSRLGSPVVGDSGDFNRLWVMQLDPMGLTVEAAYSIGDDDTQEGHVIGVNPWGAAIVAGTFSGVLGDLDPMNVLASGTDDAFLLGFAPKP